MKYHIVYSYPQDLSRSQRSSFSNVIRGLIKNNRATSEFAKQITVYDDAALFRIQSLAKKRNIELDVKMEQNDGNGTEVLITEICSEFVTAYSKLDRNQQKLIARHFKNKSLLTKNKDLLSKLIKDE